MVIRAARNKGDVIRFPQASRKDPAAPITSRTSWSRLDADSFRVGQEKLENGAWAEKWFVVYRPCGSGETLTGGRSSRPT